MPTSSRCQVGTVELVCAHETTTLIVDGESREVHWQVPIGRSPAHGWPTVLMFQGGYFSAEFNWHAAPGAPFGAFYQTLVVQQLLDHGYAVVTPETHRDGSTLWDTTNLLVPDYEASGDHALMLEIFDQLSLGTFGQTDTNRLFATGISSGGNMTSRMAVSYRGRFKALAIQSGSYATCVGPLCIVGEIPDDHPPTLFLQGELDPLVPLATVEAYESALVEAGIPTREILDPLASHEWLAAAPDEVLAWFGHYP